MNVDGKRARICKEKSLKVYIYIHEGITSRPSFFIRYESSQRASALRNISDMTSLLPKSQ